LHYSTHHGQHSATSRTADNEIYTSTSSFVLPNRQRTFPAQAHSAVTSRKLPTWKTVPHLIPIRRLSCFNILIFKSEEAITSCHSNPKYSDKTLLHNHAPREWGKHMFKTVLQTKSTGHDHYVTPATRPFKETRGNRPMVMPAAVHHLALSANASGQASGYRFSHITAMLALLLLVRPKLAHHPLVWLAL